MIEFLRSRLGITWIAGLGAISCALGAVSTAQAADMTQILSVPVESARRAAPALGVHVVEMASGETVYQFHADELRIIASNTKLFTTAAALDSLGPGYFFETNVMMRGRVRGGVLDGDLAVIGGGDPNISGRHYEGDSLAVMRSWGDEIARRGVEEISGDIYLVNGVFDPPLVHPDWPKDQ